MFVQGELLTVVPLLQFLALYTLSVIVNDTESHEALIFLLIPY